jgi:curved DNA-binding protein CbpA
MLKPNSKKSVRPIKVKNSLSKVLLLVLSDPQKRAYYNKHGRQINADSTGINPEEFFKAQFGGDKFADIIGEISIARDFKDAMNNMESGGQNDESLTAEQRVEIRTKRVEKLSSKLIDKLSLYSDAFPITENGEVPIVLSMEEISKELM